MPTTNPDTAGIRAYNDIIRRVADKYGIPVDDLFATMHDKMVTYDRGDHLHLNVEGNRMAAAQVVQAIEAFL